MNRKENDKASILERLEQIRALIRELLPLSTVNEQIENRIQYLEEEEKRLEAELKKIEMEEQIKSKKSDLEI